MTFLPIVERELRVAARRRFTFWGRVLAAAFALLIFGCLQVLAEVSHGMGFKAGQVQFSALKWMSFLFASAGGLFFTADSLSEEKREGTLGLLFLTDLRGYDVVLGKLISHSLQIFYGLLAVIPIMGITLLVGGVTGAEFGRAMLIICNTLFLSLSIGLFVSSISRDVMKAINGTLLLGLLVFAGLPFADWCLAGWDASRFKPILTLGSPVYLFYESGPHLFRQYWLLLGIQHGLAWFFLILSSICTPRAWQEKSNQATSSRVSFSQRWRFGGERGRVAMRRKMLKSDPLLWLASRDRWLPRLIWSIMAIAVILLGWAMLEFWDLRALRIAGQIQAVLGFGLLLWMASQASRFFVDGIRTGALELILVAPVGPERVVRNQWGALWRTFLIPAVLLVGFGLAGEAASIFEFKQRMATTKFLSGFDYFGVQIASAVVGIVKFGGNLAAAAWFGMWMGVTNRKVSFAVLKTLVFVIVLPFMAIWFVQILSMFTVMFWLAAGRTAGISPIWLGSLFGGILSIAKNLFFILWARKQLFTRLRDTMLRENRVIPAIPPPLAPPPIVTTGAA